MPIGYEVTGVVSALGPGTELASEGGAVGDEVVTWQITSARPTRKAGRSPAGARSRILALAQAGELVVPMAQTFRFESASAAFAMLAGPHPPGEIALVNDR